jgi:hypothetical protein
MIIIWTIKVGQGREVQHNFVRDVCSALTKEGCSLEVLITKGDADVAIILRDPLSDDTDSARAWDEQLRKIAREHAYIDIDKYYCKTNTGFSFSIFTSRGAPKLKISLGK